MRKINKYIVYLILIINLLVLISCNDRTGSDLKKQLIELKSQNERLKDSISKFHLKNIYAFHLLGTAEEEAFKVNEQAKIKFVFGYRDYIKEYDVYKLNGEKDDNKELILKSQQLSEFEYTYVPKNRNDDQIRLLAVFDLDSIKVEIPADVTVNVIE